ncbi:hypothetical protein COX64_00025 [Candidatus Dojkabacteria bacterium CG_4_10_14_0_2_um_filter_Dojkabacteria_WS6_41_15]|uniref:Nudix hydrolase domain-containing protein n=1 Tax=Candidatus Dojkabacteria bacterium CG_4_10_14_0_2_um_filter_Dojkabacteria_WS6_41_15 TaxID=2014249 RepID=A0A2M7W3M0_9BACT|nr:MAG: hypothetical protein COX64_00025 [Candidatus Dojkabacteria bacterium CG_4_10_14_0_2_um_filter_Dojkabacteria_WS6_41_15]
MKSEPELRKELLAQIANVSCFDEVERATQAKMLAWLADTPEYCRISKKPDYPTEHFGLFNVCVTPDYQEILLFEHKKSGLLLTSGGHLDKDETFQQCVVRECREEMGLELAAFTNSPFFLSQLDTHTVSAFHWEPWFLIPVSKDTDFTKGPDYEQEFTGHHWYKMEDAKKLTRIHEHTPRMIDKILKGFSAS